MISRWVRTWYSKVIRPLLSLLTKARITPLMVTATSLIIILLGGLAFALGRLYLGAGLYVIGNILDSLDAELARRNRQETKIGPFLDSVSDQIGDFSIYLGLMWFYLHRNGTLEVVMIFVALFGTLFGSDVRSRAGMVGVDIKEVGAFTRLERVLVLVVGILVRQVLIALVILAIMSNFSALQRVIYTVRVARRRLDSSTTRVRKNGKGKKS